MRPGLAESLVLNPADLAASDGGYILAVKLSAIVSLATLLAVLAGLISRSWRPAAGVTAR